MVTLTEVKKKAEAKGLEVTYVYNKKRSRYEVIMPNGHVYKTLADFREAEL